ncbi:MAG: hypothetical protein WA004_12085 [Saprospiraceae bacterium]
MENETRQPDQPPTTLNIQLTLPGGRSFPPAVFGLAILFFFFTFCEFKCGGETIGAIQGIQLITGGEIQGEGFSEGEGREFPANIWAIIAFSCAIAGLSFYLAKAKIADVVGIAAGAVGALSMFLLQASLNENVTKEAEGVVQIVYKFPFWGALISLILGAAGSYLTRTPVPIPAASPEMPPGESTSV